MTSDIQARFTAAHRTSVTQPTQDIAESLVNHLGAALAAVIAGVDRRTIARWAAGGFARAEGEKNLRAAFQVLQLIQTDEAPYACRAWFMGANPMLGDSSPATALADGRHREVMAAVRAFVNDDAK